MKPGIQNKSKLFICIVKRHLETHSKILCGGIDEIGHYYQAYFKDNIHEEYQIKYMSGKTLEEATLKFFEYLRSVFDPRGPHYHAFELEVEQGIIRAGKNHLIYKVTEVMQ